MSVPATPAASAIAPSPTIELDEVSRWYGEILGINKVSVEIRPGITGLVGPNGSGKSTMMNLITGMIHPGQGSVRVLGEPVWNNLALRRRVGYCSQSDHFYEGFTSFQFVSALLTLHGRGAGWARDRAAASLEQSGLGEAMHRRIRTYSKGMRQRVKVALALAPEPEVLILDEPFNGLDPVGRREMMRLFAEYGGAGRTLVVSSHILHEIEQMTEQILMISNGYVVAEGAVRQVRDQLRTHPFQVQVRCDQPRQLAALLLSEDSVSMVLVEDDRTVTMLTRDPDRFYLLLNDLVLKHNLDVDRVMLADENMQSIYQYLSGREHH